MLKLLGSILVVAACSAVGFGFAANIRTQASQLEQLAGALEYMKNEITYRLTPLPELFVLLSKTMDHTVGAFFGRCAQHLEADRSASIQHVFRHAMQQTQLQLPPGANQALLELSLSLGTFDATGQVSAIELAATRLRQEFQALQARRRERCRSYETIGVCAGLALAVILL